jgi:hypothetical protein
VNPTEYVRCAGLEQVDEIRRRDPPSPIVLAFGTVPDAFALPEDTRASHRWLRTWNTPDHVGNQGRGVFAL